jgi:hypothetical protein
LSFPPSSSSFLNFVWDFNAFKPLRVAQNLKAMYHKVAVHGKRRCNKQTNKLDQGRKYEWEEELQLAFRAIERPQ